MGNRMTRRPTTASFDRATPDISDQPGQNESQKLVCVRGFGAQCEMIRLPAPSETVISGTQSRISPAQQPRLNVNR